jgi:hypothetical protein
VRRVSAACVLAMLGLASVAGLAETRSIAAPAQEHGMGFLDVSSEPTAAKILIDDADLGQTTPQHHVPVRAGHHRLTLVAGDGTHKLTVGFTVEAGQTKKLTLYLAR